jgi:hypothetical protein
MTPQDWYALVNGMVYFWIDRDRLERQARACQPWPQLVLELDAERLLGRHAERATVTPINVGNARRRPAVRGRATFVPFGRWVDSAWAHESTGLGTPLRPASHRPAELVISNAVPEIMDYVTSIHRTDANGGLVRT